MYIWTIYYNCSTHYVCILDSRMLLLEIMH